MTAVVRQERKANVEIGRIVGMYKIQVLQQTSRVWAKEGRRALVWTEKRLRTCLTLMRAALRAKHRVELS